MRCSTTAAILKCPVTGDDLEFADANTVTKLHANIVAKTWLHLDGSPVDTAFDEFLKTRKCHIYYPIRDNVFLLLSKFAIVRETERERYASQLTPVATLALMRFYDQIGWKQTDRGVFHDADINEDFRDVARRYVRDCHLRVNDNLPEGGQYILDVASGPIQYDEYLTYSNNFEKRICCDVSFEALTGAARRLGDKGIYIQGDITNIPIKDGSVDGFISLHTIYHVPSEKQILAFQELERVTRKGGGGVVVYSWGSNSLGTKISAPWRALLTLPARARTALRAFVPNAMVRWIKWGDRVPTTGETHGTMKYAASHFCFYAHNFEWYGRNIATSGRWTLQVWRSVSLRFLKRRIPDNAVGHSMLALIYRMECLFPRAFGRIGQYPMFVFRKRDSTN
jgi:ubiquinone/menaquinone biosynthesis C-methylase UbiE